MGRPTGTPEFDNDSPLRGRYREPTLNDTLLHHIGSIKLWRVYRGKRLPVVYEVTKDDVLVGTSIGVLTALRKARELIPRKRRVVSQEIIGMRGWGLVGDILTPLTRRADYESWSSPVATALCDDDFGQSVAGIYCIKPAMELLEDIIKQYDPQVYGVIGLSGRVIEYEKGYRAQRAVVRLLCVLPPVGKLVLQALEERYQCPVKRDTMKR